MSGEAMVPLSQVQAMIEAAVAPLREQIQRLNPTAHQDSKTAPAVSHASSAATVGSDADMQNFYTHHVIMLHAFETAAATLPPLPAPAIQSLLTLIQNLKTYANVFGWASIEKRATTLARHIIIIQQHLTGTVAPKLVRADTGLIGR